MKQDNKELEKQQKKISSELRELSKSFAKEGVKGFHDKARCEINKKYGKGWRENLEFQKSFDKGEFNMSYHL